MSLINKGKLKNMADRVLTVNTGPIESNPQHPTNHGEQMNTITYPTGRTYDGPQVLVITIENETLDEPWVGFRTIVATFTDASRRISGRVETIVFDHAGPDALAMLVLSQYDSGAYVELCYQEAA